MIEPERDTEWVRRLQAALFEIGEFAGIPTPVEGQPIHLEDRHPKKIDLERISREPREAQVRVCTDADVDETLTGVNEWYSHRKQGRILIARTNGRIKYGIIPAGAGQRMDMLLRTIGAARGWDVGAEIAAMKRLSEITTDWQWDCYLLTGSFLETSKRSHVSYVFRRLRPTLALRPGPDGNMRCLAALCLHPIGWFDESWAGAMVPTDDLLSHLIWMRGDEHGFWRRANQHHPWEPEAGV
jgi:hypothetical protein